MKTPAVQRYYKKKNIIFLIVVLVLVGIGISIWLNITDTNSSQPKASELGYSGQKLHIAAPEFMGQNAYQIDVTVPDGWVVNKKSLDEGSLFVDELKYSPGNPYTFTTSQNERDIDRFMLSWQLASDFAKEYATYHKTDWGKVSNTPVTLYFHEFRKGETIGNVTMQGGEKEYMYYFTKDDEALQVSYFVLPGDEDKKPLIENVVRSVSF